MKKNIFIVYIILGLSFSIIFYYYLFINFSNFYNILLIQGRILFVTVFIYYLLSILNVAKFVKYFILSILILSFILFPFFSEGIQTLSIKNNIINDIINSKIYFFYNPIVPVINISIIQILIIILFSYLIIYLKNNTSKLDYLVLFSIILLGISLRIFYSPGQIWDTNFHHINYTTNIVYDQKDYYLYSIKSLAFEWGASFTDLLFIIKKIFFIKDWDISYTFNLNFLLDIINIILVFLLGFLVTNEKKVGYISGFIYSTSVITIRFAYSEHVFVLGINILLLFLINLFLYYKTNSIKYFYLSVISLIVLFYTHTIFILTPLIIILFLILFLKKQNFVSLFSLKSVGFYFLSFILLLPVLYTRFDNSLGYSARMSQYLDKNKFTDLNYLKLLIGDFNTFVYFDYNFLNQIIFIIGLLAIIVKFYRNIFGIKVVLFFLLIYFIVTFPFYSFIPYEGILNGSLLKNYTVLFLFFIGMSFNVFIFDFFKKFYINNILNIIFILIILSINFLNKDRIFEYYNQQYDFFIYKKALNYFEKNNLKPEVNLYIDHSLKYLFHLKELKYLDLINKNDIYYLLSSDCYQGHSSDSKPYLNCPNIEKLPKIFEYKVNCKSYDIEKKCFNKIMKIGLYVEHGK